MPEAARARRRLTAREFESHPSNRWTELVRGDVRVNPPPATRHGLVVSNLHFLLNSHVRSTKIGAVFGDGTGFVLPNLEDTVRGPDVSFVRADRLPPGGIGRGWLPISPDLVAEVLSPSDAPSAVEEKIADYRTAGTHLIWIVDPESRRVTVLSGNAPGRLLEETDVLDGENVVPGFRCAVNELFEWLAPRVISNQ